MHDMFLNQIIKVRSPDLLDCEKNTFRVLKMEPIYHFDNDHLYYFGYSYE